MTTTTTKNEPPALTDTALLGALRQLLREEAGAGTAAPGSPIGPDAQFRAMQDAAHREEDARAVHALQHVPCRSPETGATFTAVISFPKDDMGRPHHRHPRGHVVQLLDYARPPEADDRCPKVLQGRERAQWLYVEYFQADLRKYVGKELPLVARVDQAEKIAALEAELAKRNEAAAPAAAK